MEVCALEAPHTKDLVGFIHHSGFTMCLRTGPCACLLSAYCMGRLAAQGPLMHVPLLSGLHAGLLVQLDVKAGSQAGFDCIRSPSTVGLEFLSVLTPCPRYRVMQFLYQCPPLSVVAGNIFLTV